VYLTKWFDSALEWYKSAGNEETLTSRFGHIYSFQLWPLGIKKQGEKAVELAGRSMALVAKAVGDNSPLSLQTKFIAAMTLFCLGYIKKAPELHKEVFEKRSIRHGVSHHLTLGSQYNLAVYYQNTNNLETAECVSPLHNPTVLPETYITIY
jgi:hypothetical protein